MNAGDALAARVLVQRSPGAAAVMVCAGPRGWLDFARIYVYFRIWDDRVDAPGRDPSSMRAALADERARREAGVPSPTLEGAALDRALAGRPALIPAAEGMWAALEADAARPATAMPASWLDAQAARVGDAYAQALWTCVGEVSPVPAALRARSRAATRAHWVRDLNEDLALGHVNVPAEICASAGMDPASPSGPPLTRWAADEAERAARLLAPGPLPGGWRARWVFRAMCARYRRLAQGLAVRPTLPARPASGGPAVSEG